MKRLLSILLLGLYTTFNIGLVVNTHFCGGKLDSISFFTTKKKSCGACGLKAMSSNCCKDTKTQLLVDDNQMSSQTDYCLSDFSPLLTLVYDCFLFQPPYLAIINKHKIHFYVFETGPPKTALYIHLRSLLI